MLNMYSVYDKVSEKFSNPVFTDVSDEHKLAIRAIKAQMFDSSSLLAMFPDNYELYFIGRFDDETGDFYPLDEIENVINCQKALIELREERNNEIQK